MSLDAATREWLRAEIDRRRRGITRCCELCGAEITLEELKHRPGKRFCSRAHQKKAWLRTPKGSVYAREAKRRQRLHKRIRDQEASR